MSRLRIEPAMRWALVCAFVSTLQPYAEPLGLRLPVTVATLLLFIAALYRARRDQVVEMEQARAVAKALDPHGTMVNETIEGMLRHLERLSAEKLPWYRRLL